jgi:hypothetical protein
MVGCLPGLAHREEFYVSRDAAFDSFLVHARILGRYLLVAPGPADGATTIADVGGSVPTSDDRTTRVQALCRLADRHLDGVPGNDGDPVGATSLDALHRVNTLRRLARDLLDLLDECIAMADQAQAEPLRFAITRARAEFRQG